MSERRAGPRLSRHGLCYGLLLVLCVTASGCATGGSATSAERNESVATPADDADTSTAEDRDRDDAATSAAEDPSDDADEWRELEPDKDAEVVIMTAWLATTLAGIAAGILGLIALF